MHSVIEDSLSASARRRLLSCRGEPLFIAGWERPLFIHYEVDAEALQREVPFPLELRAGRAYVSLVAFKMRGMRFRRGGPLGRWLCCPIATHEFLNFRTYVRHRGEPGIFFLTEWLSNPLSVRLGPLTFGLPYRLGRFDYRHRLESGRLEGQVLDARTGTRLRYAAPIAPETEFTGCAPGSLDEFLLERYTAFTAHGSRRRFFRIWHEPWRQWPVKVSVDEQELLAAGRPWFRGAKLVGGNYSPGAPNALMGRPHGISDRETRRPLRRLSGLFELP